MKPTLAALAAFLLLFSAPAVAQQRVCIGGCNPLGTANDTVFDDVLGNSVQVDSPPPWPFPARWFVKMTAGTEGNCIPAGHTCIPDVLGGCSGTVWIHADVPSGPTFVPTNTTIWDDAGNIVSTEIPDWAGVSTHDLTALCGESQKLEVVTTFNDLSNPSPSGFYTRKFTLTFECTDCPEESVVPPTMLGMSYREAVAATFPVGRGLVDLTGLSLD